jgi:hypothetical protein
LNISLNEVQESLVATNPVPITLLNMSITALATPEAQSLVGHQNSWGGVDAYRAASLHQAHCRTPLSL